MSSQSNTDVRQAGWRFDNSYARLPEELYTQVKPVPVAAPGAVLFNHSLAKNLGLDVQALAGDTGAALFAGNVLPEGAEPIAQAYAGHQFGNFTRLGDGRAVLLGEQLTPDGQRFDVQLKGSGRTPYSRGGDGRAALGPMLREYILSEALHALGVPSTRSLAVVTTGEPVYRETALPGAVLTRVAASHIRVGTFEYAAALGDTRLLQALADHAISRHFPELVEEENSYLAFLRAVVDRQGLLVAKWLSVGFIHGVMNTDNVAIAGETIDYGPCAFMDSFDPATVFSSIDVHGRYAYGNQPSITQWNLARFAEALLPLLHPDQKQAITAAEEVINNFPDIFKNHWLNGMRAKLGLFNAEPEDASLIESLQEWMHQHRLDYTNTFRTLSSEAWPEQAAFRSAEFQEWSHRWQTRLERQVETKADAFRLMHGHNPVVIPRNHRVEEALEAATVHSDYSKVHRLLKVLLSPFEETQENLAYTAPPEPSDRVYQTFCGT